MNATKMTLTATVLAAALGLALGFAAAPAMADKPDPVTHMHDHSGETGDDAGTQIEVVMECFSGDVGPNVAPCQEGGFTCEGTTVQMRLDELSADFAQGCNTEMTIVLPDSDLPVLLLLSLFRISVKAKGGSGETDIMYFFTTNPDFRIGDIADVYASDRVLADLEEDEATGVVTLTPLSQNIGPLTKTQQPGKGAETVENVLVGPITYTPVPGM